MLWKTFKDQKYFETWLAGLVLYLHICSPYCFSPMLHTVQCSHTKVLYFYATTAEKFCGHLLPLECTCMCYTLFPTRAACGARQEEVTCALFISLHFTPRSSFSYNHCALPQPMCPIHTTPKELVHTKFYAAKNWARTVFIFSPVKRFDRRQKLGEERIGKGSALKMSNKVYRSNTSLTIGSGLTLLFPKVGVRGLGWNLGKWFF